MGKESLKASDTGLEAIAQSRTAKKWTVSEGDLRPLQEASKWLLQRHAETNQWTDDDLHWVQEFTHLLRVEKGQDIHAVQRSLIQAKPNSWWDGIQALIDAGEVFAEGVSYGTWSRFVTGKPIRQQTFQAYCHSLGLDWQTLIDCETEDSDPSVPPVEKPDVARIRHNLPARDYLDFIGRETELAQLLSLLSPTSRVHRISLVGIGGIGKTALMLEAAHRCLILNPDTDDLTELRFSVIIFLSAKLNYLHSQGILPRLCPDRTLEDVLRAIAYTLDRPDLLLTELKTQLQLIHHALAQQSTLLLIDNLDTISDLDSVRSFLYDLPATVKVVITSRNQEPADVVISLLPLSKTASCQLIQHHAIQTSRNLSSDQVFTIQHQTAGIPIAITYTLGQLAAGYPLDIVLNRMIKPMADLTRYCFEQSVAPLRGQPAHRLLMAIALFPAPAPRAAIAPIAAVDPAEAIEGLVRLQQLCLIQPQVDHYAMLPLTRDYVQTELTLNPEFTQLAQHRWIDWYVRFCQQAGWQDWQEWGEFSPLDQEWTTLRTILDTCMEQNRYETFSKLWQSLKGYTHTYGYWQERLQWMEWLIQTAEKHQDRVTLVSALFDHARTLTLLNQPSDREQAIDLCNRAWNLTIATEIDLRFNLLIDLASLHIQQQEFAAAQHWLARGEALLQDHAPGSPRQSIQLGYYRAQIALETGAYGQAQRLYSEVLAQAQKSGWQRAVGYTQDWLAQVAIKQGNLIEAERLVQKSLVAAEMNGDRRCLAFCQRSYALLSQAQGNQEQVRHWAELAKESFTRLHMLHEAGEMARLLELTD
ncbi:ATP-binding protein [Leptothermofonsia sichuanensis E412]|uniref:NB-ARC domain-containing protein n=1 Tax=Leptothermofonsia sichuanensis TaxID=2917832 RepID=UPI001CA73FA6|nr:NB-ARC domain-containing protein [Leptothermofonsia sichuanensis]QZZ21615.1 ATP-binding protein [Leptothermofonsia sichuanensis E412]